MGFKQEPRKKGVITRKIAETQEKSARGIQGTHIAAARKLIR
jgi:hypothetical protein